MRVALRDVVLIVPDMLVAENRVGRGGWCTARRHFGVVRQVHESNPVVEDRTLERAEDDGGSEEEGRARFEEDSTRGARGKADRTEEGGSSWLRRRAAT